MNRHTLVKIGIVLIFTLFLGLAIVVNGYGAEFHGNVQFGYIEEPSSFETQLNVRAHLLTWLELYTGIEVAMVRAHGVYFYPYRNRYHIGMALNLTDFLYIDLYHHCIHTVYSTYDLFIATHAPSLIALNKTMISVGLKW